MILLSYNARGLLSASNLSLVAAGIVALLAVFAFLNAVLTAQRGRTIAYYSVRREMQQRANRRLLLSLVLLLLAGALFVSYYILPREALPVTQPPSATPAHTADVVKATSPAESIEDNTPAPTATLASPIPTPRPAPTAPPRATRIPEPTSSLVSPLPSPMPEPSVTPAVVEPNKRLTLREIASGIDENNLPAGAGTDFQAGTPTIYIFFDYRDVPPNALLRQTWFRDGGSVHFDSQPFNQDGAQNGAGLAKVQWSPRGGFKAGLYEVRLQLGGVPQFVANFEVR